MRKRQREDEEIDDSLSASGDEDNEEAAAAAQESTPKPKPKKKKKNTVPHDTLFPEETETGSILYLRLDNFMCHNCLELRFGNCLNVITGENGSGKSAILTAIQVCFGAKSNTMRRGNKLSDLIQTGKDVAMVTIHLFNGGCDSYMKEKFGDKIIIERKISKHSTNSICIKSEKGETVGSSLKDLKPIIIKFNIQIDNPCSVMTQELARKFLKSSSDSDKYDLFLKASQLAQISDYLSDATRNSEQLLNELKSKQDKLKQDEQELEQQKILYDISVRVEDMNAEATQLSCELLWAFVRDRENSCGSIRTKLQEEQKRLDNHLAMDRRVESERLETEHQEAKKEMEGITVQITGLNEQLDQVEKQITEKQGQQRDIKAKMESIQRAIKVSDQMISANRKRIKDIGSQKKCNVNKSVEQLQREERIQKIKGDLEEARKQQESKQREYEEHEKVPQEINGKLREINQHLETLNNEKKKLEKNIDQMKKSSENIVQFFGAQMPQLLKLMQQNSKAFEKVPIGPIGLLLQLTDIKYATAVETALHSSLRCFIVHSYKDEKILRDLAKRCGIDYISSIIVAHTTNRYDTRKFGADWQQYCVMDSVLKLNASILRNKQQFPIEYENDELVFNTIMNTLNDQLNTEQAVICQELSEADQIISSHMAQQNIKECYLLEGTKLFVKGKSKIQQPPMESKAKFFKADWTQQIQQDTQQIQRIVMECGKIEQEKHGLTKQKQESEAKLRIINNELRLLSKQVAELNKQMDHLRHTTSNEQDIDYEAEIQIIEEAIEAKIEERKNEEQQLQTFRTQLQEKIAMEHENSKRNILHQSIERLSKEADVIRKRTYDILEKQRTEKKQQADYAKLTQKYRDNVALLNDKLSAEESELQLALTSAKTSHSEKIETQRTAEQIIQKHKILETQIANQKRQLGERSLEDTRQAYLNFKNQYKSRSSFIKNTEYYNTQVKQAIRRRITCWRDIRDKNGFLTSSMFTTYMSTRGISGRLEFDHGEMKLSTIVTPNKQQECHDNKRLSGGENSFTTVSFLLSLWRMAECPFRALDEPDIFMDEINRSVALKLIQHEATDTHRNRQTIILTPLSVSHFKLGPLVRIHKLKPPARGGQQQITNFIQ